MPPVKQKSRSWRLILWLLRIRRVRRTLILLLATVLVGVAIDLLDRALVGERHGSLFSLVFVISYAAIIALAVGIRRRFTQKRRFRVAAFNELLALTPTQFEMAVVDLLQDLGYRSVQRLGGPGDLAADIMCRDRKGRPVVVQCKRYGPGHSVGSREVQAFIGMMSVHHQAEHGIFVTTSDFTQPAAALARQHGIEMIDGAKLKRSHVHAS